MTRASTSLTAAPVADALISAVGVGSRFACDDTKVAASTQLPPPRITNSRRSVLTQMSAVS
jgi:hypothetical protein